MKKDKYSNQLKINQKSNLPIPFLLAQKNKKNQLPFEEKKMKSVFYKTHDFVSFNYWKNIITPLPEELLKKVFK